VTVQPLIFGELGPTFSGNRPNNLRSLLEAATMNRSLYRAGALVSVVLLLAVSLLAQGRKLKKIEKPASATQPVSVVPLPSDEQCRAAVYEVALRYGPREIENVLHPDFPNREELIDAIRRADLRVTNVRLEVESIESTKLEPWQPASADDQRASAAVASGAPTQELTSPRPPPGTSTSTTSAGTRPSTTAAAPVASTQVSFVSDCIADVRSRLVFEDINTGLRIVHPAGRAEWRLRFAR
jgi:hypothetical protein